MAKQPVIQVIDVYKDYNSGSGELLVRALNGVRLEIHEGEFVALMGTSGSGKSTLMNMLGCLDRPTKGVYRFCGDNVGEMNRDQLATIRNRRIGFVFQGFNLVPRTTALDNVMMPMLYASRMSYRERYQRAEKMLDKFGLGKRLHHFPNQLSGGQQQRVAISRALINTPAIVLADEPTGNLDTRTGLEILAEFQRLNSEENQTILMVTHDRDIANCALRQIVMQDGRIITDRRTPNRRDAASELKALLAGILVTPAEPDAMEAAS